ncbi:hypothetical protein ACS0TY_026959 [Phlomoides rotata]
MLESYFSGAVLWVIFRAVTSSFVMRCLQMKCSLHFKVFIHIKISEIHQVIIELSLFKVHRKLLSKFKVIHCFNSTLPSK